MHVAAAIVPLVGQMSARDGAADSTRNLHEKMIAISRSFDVYLVGLGI